MLNDKLTMDLSFMYSNVKEQNMLSQGEYANPLVPVYLFPRVMISRNISIMNDMM